MNRLPKLHVLLLAVIIALPAAAQHYGARQAAQARQQPNGGLGRYPAEEILRRLASMTQAEREEALSKLPPARREQIENRVEKFQKLPPAQQERELAKLELLNNLPPARQMEVRKSMTEFNKLPKPRRAAINQELRHIATMPDDERQTYIGSEEVSSRLSPDEVRLMVDLLEITPRPAR